MTQKIRKFPYFNSPFSFYEWSAVLLNPTFHKLLFGVKFIINSFWKYGSKTLSKYFFLSSITLSSNAERDAYMKELAEKVRATSIEIKNLAIERQEEYKLANFNRQEQYMEFIEQAMIQEELGLLGGIGIGRR